MNHIIRLFLTLACISTTLAQSIYNISTIAGSGNSGIVDATGTAASFSRTTGIAVDSIGNLYVADYNNFKIRKISSAGVVTTFAGSGNVGALNGPANNSTFYYPVGVAVDSAGNVYVSDQSNHKIRKISVSGTVSTLAGPSSQVPTSGAVDSLNYWEARFNNPAGIAVDSSGHVYVADQYNHRIRKISANGAVTTLAGGSFGSADGIGSLASFRYPNGVALDNSGNVYVADTNNHKIRKISPSGDVTTFAGTGVPGSSDGEGTASSFNFPHGISVDSQGNVYVADSQNHKIRKMNSAGVVTTIAGTGSVGAGNGSGVASSFKLPSGIAVDNAGNIYIADTNNYLVRKGTHKLQQEISFPNLPDITYAFQGILLSATSSSGLPISYEVTGPGHISNGNLLSVLGVGTIVVTATQSGHESYVAASPVVRSFAVSQGSQTINFSPIGNRAFSLGSLALSASASSGLPVIYQIVSGPATVSGNNLTMTGIGTIVVRAKQAGNTNYSAAASVDQSFIVSQNTQTINFGALANRNFLQTPFPLTASASSGLSVTYEIVSGPATVSGNNLTMTGLGAVVVRANQLGNANYSAAVSVNLSFVVSQGIQTITFGALPNRSIEQAPFAITASSSSGLTVSYNIVSGPATVSGNTLTITGVGVVVVRANQPGNANYMAATAIERSFNVVKANQNITFGTLPTMNPTDPAFALTATSSSGLVVSFSVISGPATVSGNMVTITGSGIVMIRASQAGNENYLAATSVDESFLVRTSQTISFPLPSTRTFVSAAITLNATSSSGLPVSLTLISGPASLSGSALTLNGIGTVVIRASQVGNSTVAPAQNVTVSMVVTPNTSAPSSIAISKNWFYDNAALNTEIGTLTAIDPDVGDVISYSLVTGTGSTDNSKFSLSGNSLRKASTALNYDTQRTAAIRIRVTDLAGQFYEQVFVLDLVDGTPWAKFEHKGTFTENPSYVNVIFQMKENSSAGRGINIPRALFDQTNDIFQLRENGSLISVSESFLQVAKIGEVPSKVRTVLLLDTSFSVGANLATIKSAAKTLVDSMFEQQEIAVYRFSGTYTLVKDFTSKSPANQAALKTAIDGITLGFPTTNLYGSALAMLNLPQWEESFTQQGIKTGFLVILTDGEDTTGEATLAEVLTKRDMDKKQIFTVGLGASLDPAALTSLGNAGYKPAADVSAVAGAFAEIQSSIRDSANSYYWLNYVSPKRGNFSRTLTVNLKNNINTGSTGMLSTTFNSNGFSDIEGGLLIDRQVNRTAGVSSITIAKEAEHIARGFTLLGFTGAPAYSWSIGNPALATLVPIGTNHESVRIIPNGNDGTTTLTLTDSVNGFPSLTISLIIGSGVALPPQTISFSAPADRAVTSSVSQLSATASSGLPVSFSLISGPATLSGNTVTLTGATGTVTIRASQAGNASYAAATSMTRSFTVASSSALLLNWASSAGLTGPNTAPTATPFNDGVPNLLKYAFNMNAAGADVRVLAAGGSAGLPQITVDQSGPEPVLRVAFLRRRGSGLIYTPQRSTALDTFVSMTGAETVTAINDEWEQVTVTETNPLPTATTSFARVRVAIP